MKLTTDEWAHFDVGDVVTDGKVDYVIVDINGGVVDLRRLRWWHRAWRWLTGRAP